MRVIKSDGTIIYPQDKATTEAEKLKLIWDAIEQKGFPNPMKSGLRGVRPMRRKTTNDT